MAVKLASLLPCVWMRTCSAQSRATLNDTSKDSTDRAVLISRNKETEVQERFHWPARGGPGGERGAKTPAESFKSRSPVLYVSPSKSKLLFNEYTKYFLKTILIKKHVICWECNHIPKVRSILKPVLWFPLPKRQASMTSQPIVPAHGSSKFRQTEEVVVCALYKDTAWYHVRGQK